ncbi:hypothetical protein MKY64_07940 [Paenibacillus sp. FSL R7-0210]|uniref:hypothetical protein n=1 Tax=Paenibacillus sp. FSL R7-0210 TaxID=2921676 RepID=UPI0030F6321E
MRSIKYNWRITKYNPEYRNNHDQFMKEDWTSFSDIGKPFNGEILTFNDYIKIESKYVNTVSFFISYLEIPYLKVTHLEKYIHNELELEHKHYQFPYFKHTSDQETFITTIKDETIVDEKQTRQLCRYILRDHLWCKLEYNDLFFVHFGFDFYMYIGCNIDCTPLIKEILTDTSLYIENCISPYID